MKHLLLLFSITFSSALLAQKAKPVGINCKYRHMRFTEQPNLSAKYWALTITEQTACQGAIPYSVKHSPLTGIDERSAFYMRQIPSQATFFTQTRDLIGNLQNKQTPFTHFELETGDIQLNNQITKNAKPGAEIAQYYMTFAVRAPIKLTATRKGDINTLVLDTNATQTKEYFLRFPMDVQLGTAPDIKGNGYPTEAELLAAWRKYRKKTELQWRDKIISEFLAPIFREYKQTYIQYEEWNSCKVYSDKNKKGGYDHLVEAAELFRATIEAINEDYKSGHFKKFYLSEYQDQFNKCLAVWKGVLESFEFDVTSNDNAIDADARQKILLNYIQTLIYTKQFEEAEQLMANYLAQDIRNVTHSDLRRLQRINEQFAREYKANAERYAWN